MFTQTEINLIKNWVKLSAVANLFGVSTRYVSQILNNERAVNTATAKNIYKVLKRYADTLSAEPESE